MTGPASTATSNGYLMPATAQVSARSPSSLVGAGCGSAMPPKAPDSSTTTRATVPAPFRAGRRCRRVITAATRPPVCCWSGSGTLYRAYSLAAATAGKATELYRFRIADWLNRFQGHLVAGGRLYVHRDKVTKGASESAATHSRLAASSAPGTRPRTVTKPKAPCLKMGGCTRLRGWAAPARIGPWCACRSSSPAAPRRRHRRRSRRRPWTR